jgi:MYXO-CTERM domain-containing protein
MNTATEKNLLRTALLAVLACALPALAGPDNIGVGSGRDGAFTVPGLNTVVNRYAQVTGPLAPGDNAIQVNDATGFAAGDLVMVMQTTGIVPEPPSGGGPNPVPLTNDPVGSWEFARLASVAGMTMNLTAPLIRPYAGNVSQVIRVPEYSALTNAGGRTIVPQAWNGTTGGVVAFLVQGAFDNNGQVVATGRGFRGGVTVDDATSTTGCSGLDEPAPQGAQKGEGVAVTRYGPAQTGRGRVANGGGGGVCYGSGGGGGGNGGTGGQGGNTDLDADGNRAVGGEGGAALAFLSVDHLLMGGGGGAGHAFGVASPFPTGGAGGGIIFVRAGSMTGAGSMIANGAPGSSATLVEGASGGGAGGTVYLRVNGAAACGVIRALGGVGGNSNVEVGTGGGGAGGRILFQKGSGTCAVPGAANVIGVNPGQQPNPGAPGGAQYGGTAGGNGSVTSLTGSFLMPTPVVMTPPNAPANGSTTNDNTPTYSGTVPTPFPTGTEIAIYVDGTEVGRATPTAGGAWTFTPVVPLADGVHTVNAIAISATQAMQSTVSNTNTFMVDTVAPAAPMVLTPADGSSTTNNQPAYTGTADPGSTVNVIVDGVSIGTVTATAVGTWSLAQPVALADGPHTVRATAMDAAGNVSPVSNINTFTVDTVAPAAPVVQTPADGSTTNNNTPAYTGTAEAGSTVDVIVDGVSIGTVLATAGGTWTLLQPVALADGPHTVRATAMDAAGNVSPVSNTNAFTVDTVAPAAPVVNTPANGSITNDNTPAFSGTAEANTTVTLTLTGPVGTFVITGIPVVGGNWTYTPPAVDALADGSYTVNARARDAAGNVSPVSNTNAFTVDTVAPAAPVVNTPANGSTTSDNTPDYSGTAEPGSTVNVIVNGVSIGTVTATAAGTWTLTQPANLPDGPHTVSATATDAAGNTSPVSNTNAFTVDTSAPVAPVVQTPANGSVTNDNTPAYSGTAEPNSVLTVTVTGPTIGTRTFTVTTNAGGTWTSTPAASLPDGQYTVNATATDTAGNTSPVSNTNTFTVDTAAPAAPVVQTPVNGSTTSDTTPDYTGTAEPGSIVTVIVDGVSIGTVTAMAGGTWTLTQPAALADGPHAVRATATDAAGNTSPSSNTNTFTVDATAPAAPVVQTPANGSTTNDNTPAYSGTAEANSTVTVIVDGVSIGTTIATAAGTWTFTPTVALADGPHTVRATATDAAGNTGPSSATNTFTVDTVAPAAPVVNTPADGSTTSDNTPAYSGTAEPGSTVTVIVDGTPVGTVTATVGGMWTFTPTVALADGPHTVRATATDAAGNTSPNSATNGFIVDTAAPAAPVVNTPADGSATNDTTPAYSGTAEPGSTVTVIVDGVSIGTTTATAGGTWTFTPTVALADGPHTVRATATDAAGNTSLSSATNTFTVDTVVPAAPVVLTPADGSTTSDNTPTYSGTAEPGSTVNVIVDGASVGTAIANAAGNWTLTPTGGLPGGSHTVLATATDAAGNTSPNSNTNTFVVDATAPAAPVVLTPADGSFTSDTTPTYTGTAEPGSTVTVIVDGASVGTVTANAAGNWTFTPTVPLANGPHSVKATASDAGGNTSPDSNINNFTVDTVAPAAPVVNTPADGSTINDSTPAYSGTAEPGSTVNVIVDGTPVGTAVANAAGNWTFTPTAPLADGPHTVRATATDAGGNTSPSSATNTFTLDTSAPAAPVVQSPANGSTTSDSTPAYSGTAEPGSTVTIIVDGTPVGTATANGAGAWSFTPTVPLIEGPHTVNATAADATGNTSPSSATNTFTVDTMAPAAPAVNTPANGSVTNDSTPAYSGTAEPGSTVTVTVDGATVGTATADAAGNWTFTPTAPLADGSHTVSATATDAAGNTSPSSATNTFTVDTAAPAAPVVVTPANGSTGTSARPVYTGTAEANSLVSVIVDGTSVGTVRVDASGNWSFTQPTPLANGQHSVKATSTDAAGNISPESNTNTFTITAVTPPAPVVTGPANNTVTNDNTPTFTGTAPAGSTVAIFLDGVQVGTTIADSNGNWSFTPPTPLEDGDYVLTVTATDSAGNVSSPSSPVNFTVTTAAGPGDKDFLGDGIGCASTAGDPSSALAMMGLALLAVLGARRRQR